MKTIIACLGAALVLVSGALGAAGATPRWEAVACRNHVYAKVKECRADLATKGFVIEKEEKAHHWEVEHAYATQRAATAEVKWLRTHHRKDAILEAEE